MTIVNNIPSDCSPLSRNAVRWCYADEDNSRVLQPSRARNAALQGFVMTFNYRILNFKNISRAFIFLFFLKILSFIFSFFYKGSLRGKLFFRFFFFLK